MVSGRCHKLTEHEKGMIDAYHSIQCSLGQISHVVQITKSTIASVSPQVISLASDRCVLASAITNSDQSGDISDATVPFWPIRRQSENSNILIIKTRSMGACYRSLYELSSRERG